MYVIFKYVYVELKPPLAIALLKQQPGIPAHLYDDRK
jgi:hypothetical protein